MTISITQIRTLALLNAGYASEVQNHSSYVLSWAMTYNANGSAGNNSGYSVGTLQSDLGQRTQSVAPLVAAYYNWAGADASKLLDRTASQLTSVLGEQGRLGLVANATSTDLSKRPLSSEEQAKFNAFLQTDVGKQAVWSLDLAQIDSKLVPFAQKVMETQTFKSLQSEDDQRNALTVAMKVFNQSESYGNTLLAGMSARTMSLSDIKADILGHQKSYINSGFSDAVSGVDLYNKVLNSNTPLSSWLKDLGDQDLSQTSQAIFAADPRFQVLERIFRDTGTGSTFVDSLAQGKPALMTLPKGLNGQARIVGIDKGGHMFSADADGANFKRFSDGQWMDSFGNYPRSDLPIIKSVGGKMVLALGGEEIELGDTAVAQVNINGFDVTLDANKGGQYAFMDDGVLIRADLSADLKLETGEVLTGEFASSTYSRTWRQGNPSLQLAFAADDQATSAALDTLTVLTDGQGKTTTIDTSPVKLTVDDQERIIGYNSKTTVEQNGLLQSVNDVTSTLNPQTAERTLVNDTTLYNSTGSFSSHTYTSTVISNAGLQLNQLDVTYNAQGSITQTSLTERQTDNSLLTTVRDGQGSTLFTTNLQTFDDGSRLETTTLANGEVIEKSFDTENQLAGTITDTPDGVGGMNRTIDTMVDGKAVHIEQHADATALANGQQAGDFDTTDIGIDGSDAVNSALIEDAMDSAYQSASDILRARGSAQLTQLLAAADPNNPGGWQPVTTSGAQAWYETAQAQQLGSVLTDVQGLIAAMKSGKPLPIATLVFSLAATVSRNPEISGISQGLGTLNSLSNFTDALQRGDELGQLLTSALARQALAPLWEVQTTKLQVLAGNPNAGLTEEERAAKGPTAHRRTPEVTAVCGKDTGPRCRFRLINRPMATDGFLEVVE